MTAFVIYTILITSSNSARILCDESICDFEVCNSDSCTDNTYICTNNSSSCNLQCNSGCQNITFISNSQNTQMLCTNTNACNDISISISQTNSNFNIGCDKNKACSSVNIQCENPNNCHCQDYDSKQCINNVDGNWTVLDPTKSPSLNPTQNSTQYPSQNPSQSPIKYPTQYPSQNPSETPTELPTINPSQIPTQSPSNHPSQFPTQNPSQLPTQIPSQLPTMNPSQLPTPIPIENVILNSRQVSAEISTESPTVMYIVTKDEIITAHKPESKQNHLSFILIIVFIATLLIGICIVFFIIYIRIYNKKKMIKNKFGNTPNDIEIVSTNEHMDICANPLYKNKRKTAIECEFDNTKIMNDEIIIKSDSEQSYEEYNKPMTNKGNGEMQLTLPQSMHFAAMLKDLPKSPNNDEGMIIGSIAISCDEIGSVLYEPGSDAITPGGDYLE